METAQVHIPLTPLDYHVPKAYPFAIYYLPLKSGPNTTQAFELLHEGLHRTFLQVPWLSGKLYPQSRDVPGWRPGQIEIRYNPVDVNGLWPYQLRFNQLDFPAGYYDELKDSGFPTDAFNDEQLVWCPLRADINNGPEVFVAQANFIPGACILTAAIYHTAGDGTTLMNIMKLWSDHCSTLQSRSRQQLVGDMPPGRSDHDLVHQLWAREDVKNPVDDIDTRTWLLAALEPTDIQQGPLKASSNGHGHMQPLTQDKEKTAAGPPRILKSAVFYISPSNFTALQRACAGVDATSRVSGNDAVCALIWRSFMRARLMAAGPSINGEARLHMFYDGRPNFSSGLPPTWLGNFTYDVQSSLELSSLADSSIAGVAATIRNGVASVDSANLLDMYTLLQNLDDFDDMERWMAVKRPSVDKNNMRITSMIMSPLASVCFGSGIFGNGGVPAAMRPLMGVYNRAIRFCLVAPRNKNGSVEIVGNLFEEELEMLSKDEEFGKYAMQLC
jgi:trichothecene 3-O-acetyltransferase